MRFNFAQFILIFILATSEAFAVKPGECPPASSCSSSGPGASSSSSSSGASDPLADLLGTGGSTPALTGIDADLTAAAASRMSYVTSPCSIGMFELNGGSCPPSVPGFGSGRSREPIASRPPEASSQPEPPVPDPLPTPPLSSFRPEDPMADRNYRGQTDEPRAYASSATQVPLPSSVPNTAHERAEKARMADDAERAKRMEKAAIAEMTRQFHSLPRLGLTPESLAEVQAQSRARPTSSTRTIFLPSTTISKGTAWVAPLTKYTTVYPVDQRLAEQYLAETVTAAAGGDAFALARASGTALRNISQSIYSKNKLEVQNLGYYVKQKLETDGIIDAQGILKLSGHDFDSAILKTNLSDAAGLEIRQNLNWVLAADQIVGTSCSSSSSSAGGGTGASLCNQYQEWSKTVKFAHVFADHLAANGQKGLFDGLMTHLRREVQSIAGFAEGLGRGVVTVVTGIPALIVNLPEVGNALYQAIVNYPTTWERAKQHIANRIDEYFRADAYEQGVIIGELTVDLLAGFVPVAGVGWVRSGVSTVRGVEFAAARAAVETGAEAALGAGRVVGETAEILLEAADAALPMNRRAEAAVEMGRGLERGSGLVGTQFESPYALTPNHERNLSKRDFKDLKIDIVRAGIRETVKYVEHNGQKHIVDGHHRVMAAKELGIREIPVEKVHLPYKQYKTIEDLYGV